MSFCFCRHVYNVYTVCIRRMVSKLFYAGTMAWLNTTGWAKKVSQKMTITLSNLNGFSKFFIIRKRIKLSRKHNPLDWCPGCWGPRLRFTFLTANKLFYLRDVGWRSRWPGTSAANCPVSVPSWVNLLQQAVKSTHRPAFWREFFQQFPRAPSFMFLQVSS